MFELRSFRQTSRAVVRELSEKNVTFMAAGIAYNAFLSLAPLLLLLVFVVSLVGTGLEDRLVALAQRSLPGPIGEVITEIVRGDSGIAGASVIGLVVLLWGTLKVFRGLNTAFSAIYETTGETSFTEKLLDGVVVLVALVVALLATVAVTSVFAAFAETVPFLGLLTPVILVVGLVAAFVPMYYTFPDAAVDLRHVLPGAVFAAVGWAALQSVFQAYLLVSGGSTGSYFGGVIVIITWLYFSGLVLLVGAVINAVLGGNVTGDAGGFAASVSETISKRRLDPEAAAASIQDLGLMLADSSRADSSIARLDGEVTVIEQRSSDDGGDTYSITFRWPTVGDSERESTPFVSE